MPCRECTRPKASKGGRVSDPLTSTRWRARVPPDRPGWPAQRLEGGTEGGYADALQRSALTGELLDFAQVVGSHERAHADHVRKVLGAGAPTPPRFDFGDNNTDPGRFIKSAVALEDLGVDAYNGAAPSLTPDTLADVARIVSVEARHAGWIRDIAGEVPAPVAEDIGISAQDARAAVNKTGFLR
jgi:Ferritin-like domain